MTPLELFIAVFIIGLVLFFFAIAIVPSVLNRYGWGKRWLYRMQPASIRKYIERYYTKQLEEQENGNRRTGNGTGQGTRTDIRESQTDSVRTATDSVKDRSGQSVERGGLFQDGTVKNNDRDREGIGETGRNNDDVREVTDYFANAKG